MRQDLIHCVVAAAHGNAATVGASSSPPTHPAFTSFQRLRFLDVDGEELDWNGWLRTVVTPVRARCTLVPERVLTRAGVRDQLGGASSVVAVNVAPEDGETSLWLHAGNAEPELRRAPTGLGGFDWAVLSVDDRTAELRATANAVLEAAPPAAMWSTDVRRALAILDSEGSGEELCDVAWPHFLLPTAYPLPARRLAAAAANCWIFGGGIAADLAVADGPAEGLATPLRDAALGALGSAVAALVID